MTGTDHTALDTTHPEREGITLLTYYLDEFGVEHCTTTQCTLGRGLFEQKGPRIRAALEVYYKSLGYVLLSVQLQVERRTALVPARPPGIRLVASNGIRL